MLLNCKSYSHSYGGRTEVRAGKAVVRSQYRRTDVKGKVVIDLEVLHECKYVGVNYLKQVNGNEAESEVIPVSAGNVPVVQGG